MQDLLSGLDSSVFDAPPSPDAPRKPLSSSKRPKSPLTHICRTPRKIKRVKSKLAHVLSPVAEPKLPSLFSKISDENAKDDAAFLLDGAEDWDWDDMNADFLTPKKSPKKRVAVSASPEERVAGANGGPTFVGCGVSAARTGIQSRAMHEVRSGEG